MSYLRLWADKNQEKLLPRFWQDEAQASLLRARSTRLWAVQASNYGTGTYARSSFTGPYAGKEHWII